MVANFLISLTASLVAALILAVAVVTIATTTYRRQMREVRRVLGLGDFHDEVTILISGLDVAAVERADGNRHRLKSNIVDYQELVGAYSIAEHLKGSELVSGLAKLLRPLGLDERFRRLRVTIRSSTDTEEVTSSSVILIGSGVFNPHVRKLHESPAVARIVDSISEPGSAIFRDGPKARDILMPYKKAPTFKSRSFYGRSESTGVPLYYDAALVQRIVKQRNRKRQTFIVLAGLGSGGTAAAIRYFIEKWPRVALMSDRYEFSGFEIVLSWITDDFSKMPPRKDVSVVEPTRWPDKSPRENPPRVLDPSGVMVTAESRMFDTFRSAHSPVVFLDYDGVLAEIVEDPDAATPLPRTIELIEALIARGVLVCVLSSRPTSFLAKHLGDTHGLLLIGNKGLAVRCGEETWEHPESTDIRASINSAAATIDRLIAEQELAPGLRLESKGLSLTIHYRPVHGNQPTKDELKQRRQQAHEIADIAALHAGLQVIEGKMAFELEPNKGVDKGTTILERVESHDWAMFAGDDIGDLVGFRAIRGLKAEMPSYAVGVASNQEPKGMRDLVDATVASPSHFQELLSGLVASRD